MDESQKAVLVCHGFTVEFSLTTLLKDPEEFYLDCVTSIVFDPQLNQPGITSVPFYVSFKDLKRLSDFVIEQSSETCENRFTYVPMNIGFQLSLRDPDDVSVSLQIMLNIGFGNEGRRVYAGCESEVDVFEIKKFATELIKIVDKIYSQQL
ncbi:hypothetical protein [Lacunimicrobium album]